MVSAGGILTLGLTTSGINGFFFLLLCSLDLENFLFVICTLSDILFADLITVQKS
jgi:hypothetical protein